MERLQALSASAGSGKTFALVARYLSLLFGGANPSEILAITFTNKAAGEMRERLISSLESMQPEMVHEVSKMSGISLQDIEAKRPRILSRFLASDLKVMTIDRFVNQVLRKFCWYAGVQSDFEIAAMPKEEFFERFLEELSDKEYSTLVEFARFEQRKSQSFIDFFEMLYEKDKELPDLSFSVEPLDEREAMEAARKIGAFLLDRPISERAKKTMRFDSLADVVAKGWFAKESLNYWDYKKGYEPILDVWFGELKEAVRRYYEKKERFFLSGIFGLYNRYKSVKVAHMKSAGQLYFKDIEHLVYELLRQKDFTDFLYFRLDARIGHILFDEFQDTSITQFRIFEPIVAEIAAGGDERSFFYVGDTKQSIYRFRGGQKELFAHVAQKFGVKLEYLDTNYRSRSEIVEFVNRTFDYVKPPQKAHKKGGYVKVTEGEEPLEMMGGALQTLFDHGVPDEDIAILVHDNKEILQVGDYVKERFGKEIATHKRALVKEQPTARAMIEMMRLIYCNERGEEGSLHRLNFLSLTNSPYDPQFNPDIQLERPAVMLKKIMGRYGFFDEAAMKLLEFSIPLNDLVEFVYEVQNYEDELPPGDIEGINVLTIHKSKGLEFEHLIVLDRLGRGRNDTSSLVFDYSGIDLKSIWVKFKNRETVDERYAGALEREKRLKASDAMNLSYVAFTRAKESLFVLKKSKSSAFGFLNLKEQCAGELKHEMRAEKSTQSRPVLHYTPKSYGRQESAAEIQNYEANDFEAIYFGLGVHYLFEMEDEDAFLNRYGTLCDAEKAKRVVETSKANMEYAFLTEGRVFHELPFVYRKKAGVIDLFVERGESGVIIDYKTATPRDLSAYKEQLKRYKEALLHLMPQKKSIDAYIFFLDTQKLVKIA